jgi:hypothetical protein
MAREQATEEPAMPISPFHHTTFSLSSSQYRIASTSDPDCHAGLKLARIASRIET